MYTFSLEITKEGSRSLWMKMANAEVCLKEATVIFGFYLLAARLPELTSKFEKLDCSHLFNSSTGVSKLSTDYSPAER